jgi:hypothetical protein
MAAPLSPLLVSILQGALQNGATRIDIDAALVVLWRGDTRLGDGDLPPGSFAALVSTLRAHGHMTPDAQFGRATFYGPLGPVPIELELTGDRVHMTLVVDPRAAHAEDAVNAALGEAARLGADSIVFAPTGLGFWRGDAVVGVSTLDAALLPAIIAHTREPAIAVGADGQRVTLTTTVETRDGAEVAVMRLGGDDGR